jgi:hypothetical protein
MRETVDDLLTPLISRPFPFANFVARTQTADAKARIAVDPANVDAR